MIPPCEWPKKKTFVASKRMVRPGSVPLGGSVYERPCTRRSREKLSAAPCSVLHRGPCGLLKLKKSYSGFPSGSRIRREDRIDGDRRDAGRREGGGQAGVGVGVIVAARAGVDEHDRPAARGCGRGLARDGERDAQVFGSLDDGQSVAAELDLRAARQVGGIANLEVRRRKHPVVHEVIEVRRVADDAAGGGRGKGPDLLAQEPCQVGRVLGREHGGVDDVGALVAAGLVEISPQRGVRALGVGQSGVARHAGVGDGDEVGRWLDGRARTRVYPVGDDQRVGRPLVEREAGVGQAGQPVRADRAACASVRNETAAGSSGPGRATRDRR